MFFATRTISIAIVLSTLLLSGVSVASPKKQATSPEALMQLVEDLKKDPCTAKVIEDEKITEMIGALSAARRAGCLDKLKLKYAFRPQFIKLMAEVMADPEVRPLLESAKEEPPANSPAP